MANLASGWATGGPCRRAVKSNRAGPLYRGYSAARFAVRQMPAQPVSPTRALSRLIPHRQKRWPASTRSLPEPSCRTAVLVASFWTSPSSHVMSFVLWARRSLRLRLSPLDIAEEALTRIAVEYEALPAVFDPVEAMQEDAPRVHADTSAYTHPPVPDFVHPGDDRLYPDIPNVVSQVFYTHGDIEAGFAQATREFTHTFTIPPVHQGYIEPHASVVQIEPDGKVNLWISNKTPFVARAQFAAALGVTEDRVCVNTAPIGGDFGGKGSLMDSVVCYHLAAVAGRPVKMVMTYTEELLAGNPASSGSHYAADRRGR